MIELREPYEPRPIRFLQLLESDGWRIKLYGIAHGRATPRTELLDAAIEVIGRGLPIPATTSARYGVGFGCVHDGRESCFVFIDWWADENELHHHLHVSSIDEPAKLEDRTGSGLIACAWDVAVIAHERTAWVRHVLSNPKGPDVEAYLGDTFSADL